MGMVLRIGTELGRRKGGPDLSTMVLTIGTPRYSYYALLQLYARTTLYYVLERSYYALSSTVRLYRYGTSRSRYFVEEGCPVPRCYYVLIVLGVPRKKASLNSALSSTTSTGTYS